MKLFYISAIKITPSRSASLVSLLVMLLISASGFAQSVITGVVSDTDGAALVGATVSIKGTSVHAVVNPEGEFSIAAPQRLPFTLVINSVGYKTREVEVYEIADLPLEISLVDDSLLDEVVVTSRRRQEVAQNVPIPISVVRGAAIEESGAFNVNRVKELVPSVQLYSSNPRNTTLNIRGLGSTFGLTNDGIDPGVGFYVDGVYYARPAASTLDFTDVERIEVLRGPQGTLFGKNTTAGAFNITTRKASFTPAANFEVSYGNFGYIQAKSFITGPLGKKFAGRLSFSGTQRDGILKNVATGRSVNDLNNLGFRAQLLFAPTDRVEITLSGDISKQRPDGYAQVIAGVVQTQRPAYRQFNQIIADLGYSLPSTNPFDRVIDHDTPWRSGNELGGLALNVEAQVGKGTLTSTTSWRYWNWDPSNDRDFTGLQALALSQATSRHTNWTQEIRYSGDFSPSLSGVLGLFAIGQKLATDPAHIEESGSAQWRFSQNSTSALWQTPGLLDGYGIRTVSELKGFGGAVFANVDWAVTEHLHVQPGIRFNYDAKEVYYDRRTYGGLQTDDPDLLALKRVVYTDQFFEADADENNLSGQLTLTYGVTSRVNTFATFSTSYKPVGVNLGGLPTAGGEILLDLAKIKPEYVTHFELGMKTVPVAGSILNVTFFRTDVEDFQTQVQTAELGVNRGYLANAEKVRVMGAEVDASFKVNNNFSAYSSAAYTNGEYVSFTNAPVPLEEVGGPSAYKDVSGGKLPGISKWTGSFGGEFTMPMKFLNKEGKFFIALDSYFRSSFSSSPSPSAYLNVDGYALVNGRWGIRVLNGTSISIWGRNLFNNDYFEQLLPAGGSAGHYAAVLGDQRTYGITLKHAF